MVATMSVVITSIGFAIGLGYLGELSIRLRFVIAGFIGFLALFGFYHGVRHRKPIHIDISSVGQLRLTEACVADSCKSVNWPHVRGSTEVVRLLKDSTFWPYLLLLRLQADSGKITTVPILPDSVSPDVFRALSAACRWIAAHNNSHGPKSF